MVSLNSAMATQVVLARLGSHNCCHSLARHVHGSCSLARCEGLPVGLARHFKTCQYFARRNQETNSIIKRNLSTSRLLSVSDKYGHIRWTSHPSNLLFFIPMFNGLPSPPSVTLMVWKTFHMFALSVFAKLSPSSSWANPRWGLSLVLIWLPPAPTNKPIQTSRKMESQKT